MASEGESDPKKIRCSEPDLKVIIGSEAEKAGGEGGEKDDAKHKGVVTKWYHTPSLAAKSKYVDALLTAPMKESESRTITFPDISPDTWDLMMKFVDDPIASRSMKPEDVVRVANFYDKYEFSDGRSLCDLVLAEYFKSVKENTLSPGTVAPDVDFIVASVVLAEEANLVQALTVGMSFICIMLSRQVAPIGRTMFSEEHLKLLAPLLLVDRTDAGGFERNTKAYLKRRYSLESDTFPREFVKHCSDYLAHSTLYSFISRIRLSGATCDVDGDYAGRPPEFEADDGRKVRFNGVLHSAHIELRTKKEGWVINLKTIPPLDEDGEPDHDSIVETVAWKAPHSGNMVLPPSKGWISAHPLARGKLKIAYILQEGEVELRGGGLL